MFWFKKCPRCSGDLVHENDRYGDFITCMQCGFNKDLSDRIVDPEDVTLEATPPPVIPEFEGGKRRRTSRGGRHFAKSFSRQDGLSFESERAA